MPLLRFSRSSAIVFVICVVVVLLPTNWAFARTAAASSCYVSDNSIEWQVCENDTYIPAHASYNDEVFYIHKLSYQPYHISEWEASCIYWEGETPYYCQVHWQVFALTWQWEPIYVFYETSGVPGTHGRIELYLDRVWDGGWNEEATAYSFRDVVIVDSNAVNVAPASISKTVQSNSNLSEGFAVLNSTPAPLTVNFSVSCTGTITNCQLSSTSETLDSASSNPIAYPTVSYNSGSVGSGRITLTASYTVDEANYDTTFTKTGYYDITAEDPLTYNASVTPYQTSIFHQALTNGTVKFKVANTGNTSANYTLTLTCTGDISNCSAASSTTVSAGGYNDITVSFTAGQNFGNGEIKLKASYSSYEGQGITGITNDPLPPRCQ